MIAAFARSDEWPLEVTDASGTKRPVIGLYVALSYDEGETWPVIRPVTDDGPPREVGTTNGYQSKFTLSRESAEPKGYLAATHELLSIHVDMDRRRSVTFPAEILARLEELRAEHQAFEQPTGVGRVIRTKPRL